MFDDISIAALVLAALIVILAGLVHGTLGLGFPLVATPLLALMTDLRSAILVTLLPTVVVNVASILRSGRWSHSLGRFWPLAAWSVAGSLLGSRLLVVSDPAPFELLLAVLVLFYLWASSRPRFRLPWLQTRPRLGMLVFGLLAGFAGGTTNVMVTLLIIYALEYRLERTASVQVFNLCFLAGKLSQMTVFAGAGLLTGPVVLATAPLALLGLAALTAGMKLRERISAAGYRLIVRRILLGLAILLLARFVAGLAGS